MDAKRTTEKVAACAGVAAQYGISLSQLTTGVLGGGPVLSALNQKLQEYVAPLVKVHDGSRQMIGTARVVADSDRRTMEAVDGERKLLAKSVQNRYHVVGPTRATASAEGTLTHQAQVVAWTLAMQSTFACDVTNSFRLLGVISLDAMQTLTARRSTFDSVSAAYATNGRAIDGASKAAVAKQQGIESVVSAI